MFSDISYSSLIFSLLVILLTYLLIQKVIRPYKLLKYYEKTLQGKHKALVQPFNIFGLGFLFKLLSDAKKYKDSYYTQKVVYPSYDLIVQNTCGTVMLSFNDPDLLKEYFAKTNEQYYQKASKVIIYPILKGLLGDGLAFGEGSSWKMKRKVMSQVFNYQFIKSLTPKLVEIADQKIKAIEKSTLNQNREEKQILKADLPLVFQQIFGTAIIKCFFGNLGTGQIDGQDLFVFVNELLVKNSSRISLLVLILGQTFLNANLRPIDKEIESRKQKFYDYAKIEIEKKVQEIKKKNPHEQKPSYVDIIELIIRQGKLKQESQANDQSDEFYTIEDLVDEFKTFFFAGTDTTTSFTTFFAYHLAEYPEVEKKLRQQIKVIFGSNYDNQELTFENLKKMKYCDCIQKEILRMCSPTSGIFPRQAKKDHYLGDIPIKKGMLLTANITSNQYKSQFFEKPFEFIPERWQKIDPKQMNTFSYYPFSTGQRSCIGMNLALLESKIAIILLLKNYEKIELQKKNYSKVFISLYAPQVMITKLTSKKS